MNNIPDFDKFDKYEQITTVFEYILNPDLKIAKKASMTVHRLFNSVRDLKNKPLYNSFRYLDIKKSDIGKFNLFEVHIQITLLCIASMNSNGYSREEALNFR